MRASSRWIAGWSPDTFWSRIQAWKIPSPKLEMRKPLPLKLLPHVVLPPLDKPSSKKPHAHGAIHKAYPHGLQFIDQMAMLYAVRAMLVGGWIVMSLMGLYWAVLSGMDIGPALVIFGVSLSITFAARFNFDSYRCYPVLFNRALGKVHVLLDEKMAWWEVWRWLGFKRHCIHTYDWACARGEVVLFTMLWRSGLPCYGRLLMLVFSDAPGSNNVVARVGVGYTDAYVEDEAAEQRFEHLRRYMQMQGPPLVEGDQLCSDPSSVWRVFTWGQPLLGPGSMDYWTGKALDSTRLWPLTVFYGLVCLALIPLTLPASLLIAWLYWANCKPKWPSEVRDSVGRVELSANELVVPTRRLRRPAPVYGPAPLQLTLKQRRAIEKERKRKARE